MSWWTNPNVWTFRFWNFQSFFGESSIFIWVLADTASAACLEHPGSLDMIWYPWLLLLSFVTLMILVQWILHKIQNHLSQCRLGVQLDLSFLGALPPIRHSSNDRCPSVRQHELLRPSFLLHRSPLFYFWLSSGPTPESFSVSPILYPLLPFAAGIFMAWGIGIHLSTKFKCCRNCPFSCNMDLMVIR